jgi:hypothetical protein
VVVSVKKSLYFCTNNQEKVAAMDEKERRNSEIRLKSLFQQIHFTVIYEKELVEQKGFYAIYVMRDAILDEIISIQRKLGLRI